MITGEMFQLIMTLAFGITGAVPLPTNDWLSGGRSSPGIHSLAGLDLLVRQGIGSMNYWVRLDMLGAYAMILTTVRYLILPVKMFVGWLSGGAVGRSDG